MWRGPANWAKELPKGYSQGFTAVQWEGMLQTVDIQSYHEQVGMNTDASPGRLPGAGVDSWLLDGELRPRPGVGTMTPRKHCTLGVV